MADVTANTRTSKSHPRTKPDKRLSSLRRALSFLQEDQQSDGQSPASSVNDSQTIMKKHKGDENVDSDTASTVDSSDYSSEGDVEHYLYEVADSPTRSFSLDDARIALLYVRSKMKHDEKFQQFQYKNRRPSASKTYSSFNRPENTIDSEKTVLSTSSDDKETINMYTRKGSISMIEDTPVAKILPAREGGTDCHVSLASPDNSSLASPSSQSSSKSKVMFPSLPPTKPPPLQLRHTPSSRKHPGGLAYYRRLRSCPTLAVKDDNSSNFAYSDDDDDTSIETHVAIANMSLVVDLDNSNDDFMSDGTTWT